MVTPVFAQEAIQYTAQLSSGSPTYNVTFNFTDSQTTATIYIDLASSTAFSNLQVTVGVGPGASVSYQITDPNGISQGTSLASGAPSSISAQNPVSGQWTLTITSSGNIATGESVPVSVTADATVSQVNLNQILEIGAILAVVIVIIAVALYLRKGRESTRPVMAPTPMGAPPTPMSARSSETQVIQKGTMQYYASLELPDGQTIPMTQLTQDFGRTDFETRVPKEVSNIISRRQFQISFSTRDKKFYIEDLGSTNGTMVNGTDIRGKGKVALNSGDVINPADVINLKFKG